MEKYAVSRDLAEKLKAAGYPQETKFYWHSLISHDMQRWSEYKLQDYKPDSDFGMRVFAAPLSDELLEQLPYRINLPDSKGTAYLEAQFVDAKAMHYDYRDAYMSVLDDLVEYPKHPHNWYNKSADALAQLWFWCKENGHIN